MLQVCGHIKHVVVLVALHSCHHFTCCQLFPLIHFSPVFEFLAEVVDSHTAKTGLLRCCLYTPRRLLKTAVSCKRSICNKIENKNKFVESRSSEVLPIDRTQRVAPLYHESLHASSFIDFLCILMKTTGIHSVATK